MVSNYISIKSLQIHMANPYGLMDKFSTFHEEGQDIKNSDHGFVAAKHGDLAHSLDSLVSRNQTKIFNSSKNVFLAVSGNILCSASIFRAVHFISLPHWPC